MQIKNNIQKLVDSLPVTCKLIVVSKTQSPEKIMEAYNTGYRVFGENKVQELVSKHEVLPKDIEWHLIGHLQTNKVKYVAPFVHLIHSVDSIKLLQEINKQGDKVGRIINCLLQVHIAEEESKFGFSEKEVFELIHAGVLDKLNAVRVQGLMGMATFTDNQEQVRNEFKKLKTLFDSIKKLPLLNHVFMDELSMGMSGDYTIAIDEGSTMIRVGTAIFGERNYNE